MGQAVVDRDIVVFGGGVTGFTYAVFQKMLCPDRDVTVYEKGLKPLGRILVSGNGRSNFFNTWLKSDKLPPDPLFDQARQVLAPDWGSKAFAYFLDTFKVPYYVQDWLIYPFANKADVLRDAMLEKAQRVGVKVVTGQLKRVSLEGFKPTFAVLDNEGQDFTVRARKAFLALGGQALQYPPFDWRMLMALKLKHNTFQPALVPLITYENTREMEGSRVKCDLELLDGDSAVYAEKEGEVLFKPDGLSGICVFNASIHIDQSRFSDYTVVLDLTHHDGTSVAIDGDNVLRSYPHPIAAYLLARAKAEKTDVGRLAKRLTFHVKGVYPFRNAEVSKGGIDLSEMEVDTMVLKKYPTLGILGELLDIPMYCGGFNIGLGIVEAYKAACGEKAKTEGKGF